MRDYNNVTVIISSTYPSGVIYLSCIHRILLFVYCVIFGNIFSIILLALSLDHATFSPKLRKKVLIMLIFYSNSNSTHAKEEQRIYNINDEVLSCSRWLSNIIDNFCSNTYKIVKRDTISIMIEKVAPKDLQVDTNRQRLVDERQWRRMRRQVASECCMRPCTVADIISYCPSDAKLLKENPEIFD